MPVGISLHRKRACLSRACIAWRHFAVDSHTYSPLTCEEARGAEALFESSRVHPTHKGEETGGKPVGLEEAALRSICAPYPRPLIALSRRFRRCTVLPVCPGSYSVVRGTAARGLSKPCLNCASSYGPLSTCVGRCGNERDCTQRHPIWRNNYWRKHPLGAVIPQCFLQQGYSEVSSIFTWLVIVLFGWVLDDKCSSSDQQDNCVGHHSSSKQQHKCLVSVATRNHTTTWIPGEKCNTPKVQLREMNKNNR